MIPIVHLLSSQLMKLERRIGDSRFKLDAKFADSDSGEEDAVDETGIFQ